MVKSHKRIENYHKGLVEQYPYEKLLKLDSFGEEGYEEDWNKSNKRRVDNFFEIVVPSLCSKYYVFHTLMLPNKEYEDDPTGQKFHCLFPTCFYEWDEVEFTTRQSLVRHILNFHGNALPAKGAFLGKPKEFGFVPVSEKASKFFTFECNNCEMEFNTSKEFMSHKQHCIRTQDKSETASEMPRTSKDSKLDFSQGIFTQADMKKSVDSMHNNAPVILSILYTEEWHSKANLPKSMSSLSFKEADDLNDTLILSEQSSSDESIKIKPTQNNTARNELIKMKRALSSFEFFNSKKK